MYEQIKIETENAVRELVEKSKLKKGSLVVVGCSSSEILGEHIGKGSSPETGVVVAEAILKVLNENGIYLAAQCCEHLNRALVVERAAAESYARGRLPVLDSEAWRERFCRLRTALRHQAGEVRHA